MKGKRKLFEKQLFLEGLRQTKWIGIVTLLLFAVAFLVGTTFQQGYMDGSYMGAFFGISMQLFSYSGVAIIYYVLVPVLMLRLFGFLTKRKSADFYHAIPHRRSTLFVSYCAVVLFWVVVIGLLWDLAAWHEGEHQIKFFSTETDQGGAAILLQRIGVFLYILVGSILSMGAMSVGMSMSGTAITSVATAMVVVFVPGIVFAQVKEMFYGLALFLPRGYTLGYGVEYSYNILSDFFESMDWTWSLGYDFAYDRETICTLIYTTSLGLMYLVIGGMLLAKRKSETAGRSSVTPLCQHILRILVAYVCGLPVIRIISRWTLLMKREPLEWESIVVWAMVTIAVYILFELITTRKWKNAMKSLCVFPAVVGLLGLTYVCMVSVVRGMASNVPEVSEIKSVSIDSDFYIANEARYDSFYTDPPIAELLEQVKIASSQATWLIQSQLDEEMDAYLEYGREYTGRVNGQELDVVIYYGSKKMLRTLHFNEEEREVLKESLIEATANTYEYEIPMSKASEENNRGYQCLAFGWSLTTAQLEELQDSLRREYAEIKPPLTVFMGKNYNQTKVYDFLEYYDPIYGNQEVPISLDTPKSLELLANLGNEKWFDFDFPWFTSYVMENKQSRRGRLHLYLHAKGEENIECQSLYWYGENGQNIGNNHLIRLGEILKNHEGESVSADENLLMVLYYDVEAEGFGGPTGQWFNLTDEEVEEIRRITGITMDYERYKYNRFDYND